MKRAFLRSVSLLILFIVLGVDGWMPHQQIRVAPSEVATTTFTHKNTVDAIANELEDLGNEIKKSVFEDPPGMATYDESLPHHLRMEIHDLKKSLTETQESLKSIENTLQAYSVVWETAELELQRERKDREQEHQSVRRLLGNAIKLMGRRVKNGFRRVLFLKIKD